MATRNEVQQVIDANVYDNVNKEILASMMRTILEELKVSYYNLDDDTLSGQRYNSSQTLQQVFSSLPIIRTATLGAFNPTTVGSVSVTSDFITDASIVQLDGIDHNMIINFNENISSKLFWFSLSTDAAGDSGLNLHNDLVTPVYRIQNTQQLNLGLRPLSTGGARDRHFLNLFML